ncbi:MAG: VOC family protein [Chloroflexi bacterium]|jgi:uncharacterized glyoxalase superfamily protein PhnB|nr:VOC family protein [Chloroflexota bacterium]NOG52592.1 hypothetical protein [Chloroflexota bacterium]GIK28530.1 MAG: glyoxalase [Chloroflexota bacterium]
MIVSILAVKDVEASVAFYSQKLGFTYDLSLPGPDGTMAFAGVSLGAFGFGLNLEPEAAQGGPGVVFMIPVPDDADIDAVYAAVIAKGVKLEQDIKTEYWGDRGFTVRDIDGYTLNIYKTVKQMTMDEIADAARNP